MAENKVYLLVSVTTERGKTDEFAQWWRRESLPYWEKQGAKHIGSFAFTIGGPNNEILRLFEFESLAHVEKFHNWMRYTQEGKDLSKKIAPYLTGGGGWRVLRAV
ncbi:NIPSNAP family protein [Chloroflexota bacterium]